MAKKDGFQKLDEALAHFRAGKSSYECEKLTGINHKKIQREAAKRGIAKGDLSQLITDTARVKKELVPLSVPEKLIVVSESDKLAQIMNLSDDTALNAAKAANNFSKALHLSSQGIYDESGLIDEDAIVKSAKVAQLTKITNDIVLPSLPKERESKNTRTLEDHLAEICGRN